MHLLAKWLTSGRFSRKLPERCQCKMFSIRLCNFFQICVKMFADCIDIGDTLTPLNIEITAPNGSENRECTLFNLRMPNVSYYKHT